MQGGYPLTNTSDSSANGITVEVGEVNATDVLRQRDLEQPGRGQRRRHRHRRRPGQRHAPQSNRAGRQARRRLDPAAANLGLAVWNIASSRVSSTIVRTATSSATFTRPGTETTSGSRTPRVTMRLNTSILARQGHCADDRACRADERGSPSSVNAHSRRRLSGSGRSRPTDTRRFRSRSTVKVVALLTCHNRRDLTLRCLERSFSQAFASLLRSSRRSWSTTAAPTARAEAVWRSFDSARVFAPDGSLFWARGMQLAESTRDRRHARVPALAERRRELDPVALDRLLATAGTRPDAIVVGALLDPETRAVTYSGVVLSRWHPMRARLVEPGEAAGGRHVQRQRRSRTSRRSTSRVGPIDGGFSHGQADFDYGLRARTGRLSDPRCARSVGCLPRGGEQAPSRTRRSLLRRAVAARAEPDGASDALSRALPAATWRSSLAALLGRALRQADPERARDRSREAETFTGLRRMRRRDRSQHSLNRFSSARRCTTS